MIGARARARWGTHLVLAASACAGTPIEAGPATEDTTGATEFPEPTSSPTSSTVSATSLETSQSASDSASASTTNGDPTTTATDSSGVATDSTGGETSSTTADTSRGTSSDDGDDESESSDDDAMMESSTGDAPGGCLGRPLRDVIATECSEESEDDAELSITNGCDFAIEVYWVDYGCAEDSYATLDPDEAWSIATYQTHPWRVRNAATDELLLEIPPLAGDTMFTIE